MAKQFKNNKVHDIIDIAPRRFGQKRVQKPILGRRERAVPTDIRKHHELDGQDKKLHKFRSAKERVMAKNDTDKLAFLTEEIKRHPERSITDIISSHDDLVRDIDVGKCEISSIIKLFVASRGDSSKEANFKNLKKAKLKTSIYFRQQEVIRFLQVQNLTDVQCHELLNCIIHDNKNLIDVRIFGTHPFTSILEPKEGEDSPAFKALMCKNKLVFTALQSVSRAKLEHINKNGKTVLEYLISDNNVIHDGEYVKYICEQYLKGSSASHSDMLLAKSLFATGGRVKKMIVNLAEYPTVTKSPSADNDDSERSFLTTSIKSNLYLLDYINSLHLGSHIDSIFQSIEYMNALTSTVMNVMASDTKTPSLVNDILRFDGNNSKILLKYFNEVDQCTVPVFVILFSETAEDAVASVNTLCKAYGEDLLKQKQKNGDNILHLLAKNESPNLTNEKYMALSGHKLLQTLLTKKNRDDLLPFHLTLANPYITFCPEISNPRVLNKPFGTSRITPLHALVMSKKVNLAINELRDGQVELKGDIRGNTALNYAIKLHRNEEFKTIFSTLLSRISGDNMFQYTNKAGDNMLSYAIQHNNAEIFQHLLDRPQYISPTKALYLKDSRNRNIFNIALLSKEKDEKNDQILAQLISLISTCGMHNSGCSASFLFKKDSTGDSFFENLVKETDFPYYAELANALACFTFPEMESIDVLIKALNARNHTFAGLLAEELVLMSQKDVTIVMTKANGGIRQLSPIVYACLTYPDIMGEAMKNTCVFDNMLPEDFGLIEASIKVELVEGKMHKLQEGLIFLGNKILQRIQKEKVKKIGIREVGKQERLLKDITRGQNSRTMDPRMDDEAVPFGSRENSRTQNGERILLREPVTILQNNDEKKVVSIEAAETLVRERTGVKPVTVDVAQATLRRQENALKRQATKWNELQNAAERHTQGEHRIAARVIPAKTVHVQRNDNKIGNKIEIEVNAGVNAIVGAGVNAGVGAGVDNKINNGVINNNANEAVAQEPVQARAETVEEPYEQERELFLPFEENYNDLLREELINLKTESSRKLLGKREPLERIANIPYITQGASDIASLVSNFNQQVRAFKSSSNPDNSVTRAIFNDILDLGDGLMEVDMSKEPVLQAQIRSYLEKKNNTSKFLSPVSSSTLTDPSNVKTQKFSEFKKRIAEELAKKPYLTTESNSYGINAMHIAAFLPPSASESANSERRTFIEFLSENGMDIHSESNAKVTPLHLSLAFQTSKNSQLAKLNIKEIKHIRRKAVNPEEGIGKTTNNSTLLHFAAMNSSVPSVHNLLVKLPELAKQISDKNNLGVAPIHLAAFTMATKGNFDQLSVLKTFGADVNAQDNEGNTPLHYAISGSNPKKAIQALIAQGAVISIANNDGITPLLAMLLKGSYCLDSIRMLSNSKTWNKKAKNGLLPLTISLATGKEELLDIAIANNVNSLAMEGCAASRKTKSRDVPYLLLLLLMRDKKPFLTLFSREIRSAKTKHLFEKTIFVLLKLALRESEINRSYPSQETFKNLMIKLLNSKDMSNYSFDCNVKDQSGDTIIIHLIRLGDQKLLKAYLNKFGNEANVSFAIQNNANSSALKLIENLENAKLKKYLVNYGKKHDISAGLLPSGKDCANSVNIGFPECLDGTLTSNEVKEAEACKNVLDDLIIKKVGKEHTRKKRALILKKKLRRYGHDKKQILARDKRIELRRLEKLAQKEEGQIEEGLQDSCSIDATQSPTLTNRFPANDRMKTLIDSSGLEKVSTDRYSRICDYREANRTQTQAAPTTTQRNSCDLPSL